MNNKKKLAKESSARTYYYIGKRVYGKGISLTQALEMPNSELKELLDFHGQEVSFKALKRGIYGLRRQLIAYYKKELNRKLVF